MGDVKIHWKTRPGPVDPEKGANPICMYGENVPSSKSSSSDIEMRAPHFFRVKGWTCECSPKGGTSPVHLPIGSLFG